MMGLFNPPLRKPINPLTIVGTTNPYFQLASGDDGPAILFETSRFNSSIGCITNTTSPLYGGFHGSKFTLLNEDYTANPIVPFDLTKDTLWTIDFASKPETGSLFPPSVLEAIINKSVFLNDNFAEDTNDWTITPNGSVVVTHSVSTLDNGKQSSGKCCVITATTAASSDNVFVIEQNDVDLSGVTSISLSTSYEVPAGNETYAECDVLFWKDTTSSWVHIDTFEITSTHTQFTSSLIPEDIELFSKIRLVYQFMYFTVSPADPLVIYLSDLITAPNYSRIHTRWKETNDHTHTETDITDMQDYTRWRGSSATAPDSPSAGDRYYNSTDSRFYEYDGSSWITTPKFHGSLATEPSSAVGGDTYYNSGDSKPYFYTGSAWVALT